MRPREVVWGLAFAMFAMADSYHLIPYFLAILVAAILLFSLVMWHRGRTEGQNGSITGLLLLGLLLIAIFALGAFVMYVFLVSVG
jgi:NADH:ubiquinone oxidoreductase subunit 2 (subunit N)